MRLDLASWPQVDEYLKTKTGIILPVGSTEQHGPIGLIGTDAICATFIAEAAADLTGIFVAPTLALTPAPFNTDFPGTISISEQLFISLFSEVIAGLQAQGFERIYVLNAHGANLAPMRSAITDQHGIRIRSWWDFANVNRLRESFYGEWEGMHATPAEIAITMTRHDITPHPAAETLPRRLSVEERQRRAGDNHGPPDLHRSEFPDGRVGSHSALATKEHGTALLNAATQAVADDLLEFANCDDPIAG